MPLLDTTPTTRGKTENTILTVLVILLVLLHLFLTFVMTMRILNVRGWELRTISVRDPDEY